MPSVAATVVRGWVAVYTRGLPGELRDGRRAEIESDLWAHAEDAYVAGHPPTSLDAEMLVRLATGIPADIAWRWSHQVPARPLQTKDIGMHEPRSHQALTVIGVGLAAIGLAFAVLNVVAIQQNTDDRPSDVLAASAGAVAMMAGLALALVGLLIVSRNPTVARQLAIVGAAVIGGTTLLVFAWAWPIGIAMALPAVIGVVRARQVTEARGRQTILS